MLILLFLVLYSFFSCLFALGFSSLALLCLHLDAFRFLLCRPFRRSHQLRQTTLSTIADRCLPCRFLALLPRQKFVNLPFPLPEDELSCRLTINSLQGQISTLLLYQETKRTIRRTSASSLRLMQRECKGASSRQVVILLTSMSHSSMKKASSSPEPCLAAS